MQTLPFRTNATYLSDDELILLDILFQWGSPASLLRRKHFHAQWNLGYSHNLDDDQLRCRLRWLCEHGVLTVERDERKCLQITQHGFELWSQERCPVWEQYCMDRYGATLRDRTMITVVAVSPKIRDDFLKLCPLEPARRRTATIADYGLIRYRSFDHLYVGVATWQENVDFALEDTIDYGQLLRDHDAAVERERSWWGFVPDLQKFIGESDRPKS